MRSCCVLSMTLPLKVCGFQGAMWGASTSFADFVGITSYVMGTESFDEDAFAQQVEEIRVLAEGRLEYRFADGRTVTWEKA